MKYEPILISDMNVFNVDINTDTGTEAALRVFAKAIREQLRGVRFAKYRSSDTYMLYVYYPDDVFPLGAISYSDMKMKGVHPRTFNVSSRAIVNKRFDAYREQYHMVMSGNMDRAVKNALKYLRMYTLPEMMRTVIAAFLRAASNYTYVIRNERNKVFSEVNMDLFSPSTPLRGALLREMQFMLDEHKFYDSSVKDVIARMLEVYGRCDLEERFASGSFWFVRAKQDGSFDTIYKKESGDPNEEQKAYAPDTAPEVMAHRLAILSINNSETYVGGIGYRYCNDLYFVYDKEAPENMN